MEFFFVLASFSGVFSLLLPSSPPVLYQPRPSLRFAPPRRPLRQGGAAAPRQASEEEEDLGQAEHPQPLLQRELQLRDPLLPDPGM